MLQVNRQRVRELEKKVLTYMDKKFEGLPATHVGYKPAYVGYHSRRFAYLAHFLETIGINKDSTILDVGPTFTSIFFHDHLGCRVDSLSFSPDEETPFGRNYFFDLNKSQDKEEWPRIGPYEVITFAEVIEHCYTSPQLVLECMGSLLKPGGYMLVQTPNALALRKRIQLLMGRHPYEEISLKPTSPNHFRESTLQELIRYGKNAGLEVEFAQVVNYFNPTYRQKGTMNPKLGAAYFRFNELLPQSLKPGCMLVYRRPQG